MGEKNYESEAILIEPTFSNNTTTTTTTTTTTATLTKTTTTATKSTTTLSKLNSRLRKTKARLSRIFKTKNSPNDEETDEYDEKLFFEMLKSLSEPDKSESADGGEEESEEGERPTTTPKKKLTSKKKAVMIRKSENNAYDANNNNEMEKVVGENEKSADKYKRMCIVTNWSQFRPGRGRFQFELINVDLCNYIIFSSIVVIESESTEAEYNDEEEYILKPVQHNDFGRN